MTRCDICGRFGDVRETWPASAFTAMGGPSGTACKGCRPDLWRKEVSEVSGDER